MDAIQTYIHNMIYNPYRSRAFNTTATSFANSSTPSAFPMDTLTDDPDGEGGTANPIVFTIWITGYYLITANFGTVAGNTHTDFWAGLKINGAAYQSAGDIAQWCDRLVANAASDQIQCNFSKMMKFNKGDTIAATFVQNSGAAHNSVAGNNESWIEISLLGPA